MKNYITLVLVLASFAGGFSAKSVIADSEPRATGIGGVFFKCKNPAEVREWYKKHLGLNTNKYGSVF